MEDRVDRIGRYRVVRQLGRGGMGEVFLARDPSLERDVAIKLLRADAWQAGLREEARALAQMNHPGIVTIFEIGEHAGQDFIAMEYLSGRTLRQLLAEGATPRAELLAICVRVASAVGASHRAGILHRDIKPENVVVTDGGVKVVDFGIARRLDAQRAARPITAEDAQEVIESFKRTLPPELGTVTIVNAGTQAMFGTPAYMAPEVLLGGASTAASDVYSLGVVAYECIAGRRPYDAQTVVEVMAQMIEEPPAPLADPLGALVARMLASDPSQRPTLEYLTAHLVEPGAVSMPEPVPIGGLVGEAPAARSSAAHLDAPPRRGSRAWLAAALALAAAAAAVAAWQLTRRSDAPAPPPPALAAPLVTASIAVGPLTFDVPSYGAEPPNPDGVADTLARMFDQIGGAKLSGIALATGDARAVGAAYALAGHIKEDGGELRARFELTRVDTGARVALVQLHRPAPHMAQLVDAIAADVARAVAPGAALDLSPNRVRAEAFYRQGETVLESGRFTSARPYLEQAVDADPTLFDAWYALALVLGWMDAPEDAVLDATTQAVATAGPGPKRDFMNGVAHFLGGEFGAAREALAAVEAAHATDGPHPRDLYYFLGEANWHDGRHAPAFAYFKRSLDADPRFRPPTVHAWQYTLARRDEDGARYYLGLAGDTTEWIDFEAGRYAQILAHGTPVFQLWAELVRGGPLSAALAPHAEGDGIEPTTLRLARALDAGDAAAARAELTALWPRLLAARDAKQLTSGDFFQLEVLGEVLLCANLGDDARHLVALLADASTPHRAARGYQRLAALTAALVHDPSLVVRGDGVPERVQRLADATDAELAGDHKRAATVLAELVADPTFAWDYPERAALLRNLRALHDAKRAAALCTDTLRPAVFRTALLALRPACRAR